MNQVYKKAFFISKRIADASYKLELSDGLDENLASFIIEKALELSYVLSDDYEDNSI